MALNVTQLVGNVDQTTGALCPPGKQFKAEGIEGGDRFMPEMGGQIRSRMRYVHEHADFWAPGNRNSGIEFDANGRALPSIIHDTLEIALTDVTGADLGLSPHQLEAQRRNWYAHQVATGPVLTPIHHIIGSADEAWRGRISPGAIADRDEWRSMLWEPEQFAKLMKSHAHLYTINWAAVPLAHVVEPLELRLKRLRKSEMAEAGLASLRLRRARADVQAIKAIGASLAIGDMDKANLAYSQLAKNDAHYKSKASELDTFTDKAFLGDSHD